MTISIVISSYNGVHLLEKYLPFLFKAIGIFKYEIIVVDDGSKDGTFKFIKREYPSIKLVRLNGNRGFPVTSNTGARASSGDIILFLNNDVKVTGDFLAPLCHHFDDHNVFAVSPKVLLPEYKNNINEGLSKASFHRGMFVLEFLEADGKRLYSQSVFSLYASGGAMAVDRKKFLSIGGFDSMFSPFYCEDMDLCYRAWKRGWKIIYEPKSIVYHHHQSTIGKLLSQKKIDAVIGRNQLLFMWKNLTDNSLFLKHWLWLPRNIIGGLRMRSYSCLRNFLNALPKLLKALRAREHEKRFAIRGDREVLKIFSSDEVLKTKTRLTTRINTRSDSNKVLIIMPQSFGDVYRMTGIVDSLKRKYPDKKIDFMTKRRYFSILEENPFIEKIIPYPENNKSTNYAVEFDRLPEKDEMLEDYCHIYTPYYGFQLSYDELLRNKSTGKNVVEIFAELCGLTKDKIGRPCIKEEKFPIDENSYIIIHPRTYDDSRNWDYFPYLVKLLVKYGYTVCQVGLNNDELINNCRDYRKISLSKFSYFLKNALAFIGVDSFPAHLSGGVGTATIVLYGGTDAVFSKPYWGDVVTLEPDRIKFGCQEACHAKNCSKRRKCINGIKPKDVLEKVLMMIEGKR